MSTQMQPIGFQPDIQGEGKGAHAGKHFQNSLQIYLHMVSLLKLSLGHYVTLGSLSGIPLYAKNLQD